MAPITAPCTCSVDGISGNADTRYQGYSFTGCGAHVEYHYNMRGAGYDKIWCYVTYPPECPDAEPYIDGGFSTRNALPSWKAGGAAWKTCGEGYRCEAWWGSIGGTLAAAPVTLDAPMDWPDCCAVCSTSSSACKSWSFDPSTGLCLQLSEVNSSTIIETGGWRVTNATVWGYPGYLEEPVTGCISRNYYDLCDNMILGFLIPGIVMGFCALSAFVYHRKWWEKRYPSPKFFETGHFVLARCDRLSCTERLATRSGKFGPICYYENTFQAVFSVPSGDSGTMLIPATSEEPHNRSHLQKMYNQFCGQDNNTSFWNMQHHGNLFNNIPNIPGVHLIHTDNRRAVIYATDVDPSSDVYDDPAETFEKNVHESCFNCSMISILIGASLLLTMCILLLTNDAAQAMAPWTFPRTSEKGRNVASIIGIALCIAFLVFIPLFSYRIAVKRVQAWNSNIEEARRHFREQNQAENEAALTPVDGKP